MLYLKIILSAHILPLPKLKQERKKNKKLGFGYIQAWLRYVFSSVFDNFYIFEIVASSTTTPMLKFWILMNILSYAIDESLWFLFFDDEIWKIGVGLTYFVLEFLMVLSN